jgi:D-alanine-D-alanine ligase-like ATP-grasp enzyme
MKIVGYIILNVFVVAAIIFFYFFKIEEKGIKIREENKILLKIIVRKAERIVYDEATKHNPEGDLVPDKIDDDIKNKLKQSLNK